MALARHVPDGYPIYVEWITLADFNGDIHVSIADSSSGKEVAAHPAAYMHDAHVLVPSDTQVIAAGPTPPYRIFVTTVTIPAAGCYTVTTSSGCSWSAIVAVGK
jgi:hypothetical protein